MFLLLFIIGLVCTEQHQSEINSSTGISTMLENSEICHEGLSDISLEPQLDTTVSIE